MARKDKAGRNVVSGRDRVTVQGPPPEGKKAEPAEETEDPKATFHRSGNAKVGIRADEIHGDITIR